ncbi:MAG: hypothetical protein AAGI44_05830 [Pseudomonadota bacterium]
MRKPIHRRSTAPPLQAVPVHVSKFFLYDGMQYGRIQGTDRADAINRLAGVFYKGKVQVARLQRLLDFLCVREIDYLDLERPRKAFKEKLGYRGGRLVTVNTQLQLGGCARCQGHSQH